MSLQMPDQQPMPFSYDFNSAFGSAFDESAVEKCGKETAVLCLTHGLTLLRDNSDSKFIRAAAGTTLHIFENDHAVNIESLGFNYNEIEENTSASLKRLHLRFRGDGITVEIPSTFVDLCKNDPIRSLFEIVNFASEFRDVVNFRHMIDGNHTVDLRGKALQAHFINGLKKGGVNLSQYLTDTMTYFTKSIPQTESISLIDIGGNVSKVLTYPGALDMYFEQRSQWN